MRKIILTILLLFLFLAFSGSVQAATDTIVDYPILPGATTPGEAKLGEELPEFIKYIFVFSLGAVGVTALIVIIIAAFGYVTSVGNPQKAAAAKDRIAAALLGMLLLLGSYLLLRTINPDLLRLGVTLEEVGVAEIEVEEGDRKWLCVLEDVEEGCDVWYDKCYAAENKGDCEELCESTASELGKEYKNCQEFPGGCTEYQDMGCIENWMCILENPPTGTCASESEYRYYAGCKGSRDACETYCDSQKIATEAGDVYGCSKHSTDECLALPGTCY